LRKKRVFRGGQKWGHGTSKSISGQCQEGRLGRGEEKRREGVWEDDGVLTKWEIRTYLPVPYLIFSKSMKIKTKGRQWRV